MAAPIRTAPRAWANGDVLTQPRAQAYLADNFDAGPRGTTIAALNAQFGPNGPGVGARGLINVIDANSIIWEIPLVMSGVTALAGFWASDWRTIVHTGTTADTGTTYAITDRGPLLPYKAMRAAGLDLQIDLFAVLVAGASSTEFAAALCSYGSVGGALTDYTGTGTAEVSTVSTTADLEWNGQVGLATAAVTAIGTNDYVWLALANKRSGSNAGSVRSNTTLMYRWFANYP